MYFFRGKGKEKKINTRCLLPMTAYAHKDVSFLPVPENPPKPRLIIIYPNGILLI